MTKQEAIQIFIDGCRSKNPSVINQRQNALNSQFQRNVWELNDVRADIGKIRIRIAIPNCGSIAVFYYKYANPDGKQIDEFELTIDEYNELEKEYFGKLTSNEGYIKRITHINDNISQTNSQNQ